MNDVELPQDDAFVRTAIRGMQTPDHHPDFWDDLASMIDASEGPGTVTDPGLDLALGAPREFEMPGQPVPRGRHVHARPAHRAGDHAPRRAPLRAVPLLPDPELAPAPAPTQVHIAAPTAAVPAAAAAGWAPAPAPSAPASAAPIIRKVADPLSKLKIEHDAATMPYSMRRTSNIVLLTVALAAVMVALFAGLSLVRQRSDSGAPAPVEVLAA